MCARDAVYNAHMQKLTHIQIEFRGCLDIVME